MGTGGIPVELKDYFITTSGLWNVINLQDEICLIFKTKIVSSKGWETGIRSFYIVVLVTLLIFIFYNTNSALTHFSLYASPATNCCGVKRLDAEHNNFFSFQWSLEEPFDLVKARPIDSY